MHTRQIAHTSSYRHIALILNGTSLGAHPHSRVSILRISHEWHEEYLHTILRHQSGKLWELHVITDKDAYLATVGIECLDMASSAQPPALLLIRGYVYLLVHIYATISATEETHVIECVVLQIWHTARDDIDVVTDG